MNPRDRLARIIDQAKGIIRDAESWNDNRPDAAPFDCETERVVVSLASIALRQWDSGDRDSALRSIDRVVEYVKSLDEVTP